MKEKDIAARELEQFSDVYADILNVLLFDGEQVVLPEELFDWPSRSSYLAKGQLRELERDIPKHWVKDGVCLACFGLENETSQEADMPLRIIGYDGAEYRQQLLKENRNNPRYGVVSLVLYFHEKKRWKASISLRDRLSVPSVLKKHVTDFRIRVVDIGSLTRGQVSRFRSDFYEIADYYAQLRETGEYYPHKDREMVHPEAVVKFLCALTKDRRFLQAWEDGNGEDKRMCEVLDRIEAKGRKEGRRVGRREGRREGRRVGRREGAELTLNILNRRHLYPSESCEETALALNCSIEEVSFVVCRIK